MYNAYMAKKNDLSEKIAIVLVSYAKTQLLLIIAVTVVTWVILSALGVEYPLLLSLLTGSVSIIPILGLVVAAGIAFLVAIFDSVRFLPNIPVIVEGVVVLVIYGLLNIAIDYFLSPYLIGKTSNMHPVALLAFVLLGTAFFGILGALFTVPIVLVLREVYLHYTAKKK